MALFRTKNQEDDTETVTIPDFVEDKTESKSESVDMSIFKMADDKDLYDEPAAGSDDEYVEVSEGKGNNLLLIILIVLLTICTAAAAFFAYREHNNYVDANTKLSQVLANEDTYKQQIAEKDNLIVSLQQQLDDIKNDDGTTSYYVIDGGMVYRKTPTLNGELTSFNGNDRCATGETLKVYAVIDDNDLANTKWAKLADDVYVCIVYDGEVWAQAQ
ncbi:MAG: hypothetical protein Q4D13_08840 [Erysipelotrichaceae bacterium]|nr:hypothetical protein [Erysipelotrichaceae bacterium]